VQHHHDVGAVLQRPGVTGLLVAAVATVLVVDVDRDVELAGDRDGFVAARVVDQDQLIRDPGRDVGDGPLERVRRVVRGHGDDDLGHRWPRCRPA
jgi:hypothetical protein